MLNDLKCKITSAPKGRLARHVSRRRLRPFGPRAGLKSPARQAERLPNAAWIHGAKGGATPAAKGRRGRTAGSASGKRSLPRVAPPGRMSQAFGLGHAP